MTDQDIANCLPAGETLKGLFELTGAVTLEVRGCLTNESEEGTNVSSDHTLWESDFLGIYVRDREGLLQALHDMPRISPVASRLDMVAALNNAVLKAHLLSIHTGGGRLPVLLGPSLLPEDDHQHVSTCLAASASN